MSGPPGNANAPDGDRGAHTKTEDAPKVSPAPDSVKEHPGWFPCFEQDFRTIEQAFDDEGTRRKAKCAYVTLHRVANLRGSSTFSASVGSLARDMDYSVRHAAEALQLLAAVKLVRIATKTIPGSKLKAPSVYTILRKVISMPQNEASILQSEKISEGASTPRTPPRTTNNTSILPEGVGIGFEPGPSAAEAFRQARTEAGLRKEGERE